MKFKLEIRTDNAVYEESLYDELIANLQDVIKTLDTQDRRGNIHDTNGNRVGKFYMVEEE